MIIINSYIKTSGHEGSLWFNSQLWIVVRNSDDFDASWSILNIWLSVLLNNDIIQLWVYFR